MQMDMPMHHDAAFSFGKPGRAADVTRTVSNVLGNMDFTPNAIEVKRGEVIRFVLKNASAVDHDFTLGDAATQTAHRVEMANAAQSGHMMHHHGGGNAIDVKAGETRELIWAFSDPMTLEFDCDIPGHYESGMRGTIAVLP